MHAAPANSAIFISQVSFLLRTLFGAGRRVVTCSWSLSLSFSTAHAAAMPLPFDALPRRVTPKLAGYIVSQWGALTALGFSATAAAAPYWRFRWSLAHGNGQRHEH